MLTFWNVEFCWIETFFQKVMMTLIAKRHIEFNVIYARGSWSRDGIIFHPNLQVLLLKIKIAISKPRKNRSDGADVH